MNLMEIDLPDEIKLSKEFAVKEGDTASFLGSGTVPVLATPSMILLMEMTALKALGEHLPEGISSVGTKVDVNHQKAVIMEEIVNVEVEAINIDGRKIEFAVKVLHNDDIVGEGTHTRFIIDENEFMESLQGQEETSSEGTQTSESSDNEDEEDAFLEALKEDNDLD